MVAQRQVVVRSSYLVFSKSGLDSQCREGRELERDYFTKIIQCLVGLRRGWGIGKNEPFSPVHEAAAVPAYKDACPPFEHDDGHILPATIHQSLLLLLPVPYPCYDTGDRTGSSPVSHRWLGTSVLLHTWQGGAPSLMKWFSIMWATHAKQIRVKREQNHDESGPASRSCRSSYSYTLMHIHYTLLSWVLALILPPSKGRSVNRARHFGFHTIQDYQMIQKNAVKLKKRRQWNSQH